MSMDTLTRAWTDVEYRATLTDTELDLLANPAGDLDAELSELAVHEATAVSTACTKWSAVTAPRRCCC